ncbi:hypothetical protein J5226_03590 [Lysobacter sp. K5869]|uniref:hypothetical protein n=1 Tax=Lysobacter sp. K5869 TaxID=2820808 RepID=UPI001C05F976|nr:hypothetical protein [Lysobacter sp. K5869]QWP77500.1 hypothetical protein J5226_03590 [Lysobacter sp. K5869]
MLKVSVRRFRNTAAMLSDCHQLVKDLADGKPTTPLCPEEMQAAREIAQHCYDLVWMLCDSARMTMGTQGDPNELMGKLWRDDQESPGALMDALWMPHDAD